MARQVVWYRATRNANVTGPRTSWFHEQNVFSEQIGTITRTIFDWSICFDDTNVVNSARLNITFGMVLGASGLSVPPAIPNVDFGADWLWYQGANWSATQVSFDTAGVVKSNFRWAHNGPQPLETRSQRILEPGQSLYFVWSSSASIPAATQITYRATNSVAVLLPS